LCSADMNTKSYVHSQVTNLRFLEDNATLKVKEKEDKNEENKLTIHMRRKTLDFWMKNLIKEERREEKLYLLGRRCLDRFLSSLDYPDTQLIWSSSHLLGAACLLVTSKTFALDEEKHDDEDPDKKDKKMPPLAARDLIKYAGHSFGIQELLDCELLLLSKLGWDVYLDCQNDHLHQEEDNLLHLDNLTFG